MDRRDSIERTQNLPPWDAATVVAIRTALEDLYTTFNHRREIHPDPLEFLYRFENPRDREAVGLIAACLAYGRVASILQTVTKIVEDKCGVRL